jgi:hypothetical protein
METRPDYFTEEQWNEIVRQTRSARPKELRPTRPTKRIESNELITEDNCALQFANLYAESLRYDHDMARWFEWDGFLWRPNNKYVAFQYARELVRDMARRE